MNQLSIFKTGHSSSLQNYNYQILQQVSHKFQNRVFDLKAILRHLNMFVM